MRHLISSIVLGAMPVALAAQAPQPAVSAVRLSEAQQIASAVLPLPAEFRAGARVLGYRAGRSDLVTLREGNGPFICLASNPELSTFHVACYHRSLEPFMARGRSLRAAGVKGDQVDTARFAEIRSRKLKMPTQPAALYSLTGPAGAYDTTTGNVVGARALSVIYIAGATSASTGLSDKPVAGAPWIMYPGTPKAHIMLVPKM